MTPAPNLTGVVHTPPGMNGVGGNAGGEVSVVGGSAAASGQGGSVNILPGSSAGGGYDTYARLIARKMPEIDEVVPGLTLEGVRLFLGEGVG